MAEEGICINSFLLSMEVLTKSVTSKLYYSDYEQKDTFLLLLHIMKADHNDIEK
jgi:hypothetical protein